MVKTETYPADLNFKNVVIERAIYVEKASENIADGGRIGPPEGNMGLIRSGTQSYSV